MILETVRRVLPMLRGWQDVFVSSGTAVEAATRDALPDLPAQNLLVEPAARNTAPCIAWATATIARTDPDAVVVVLPSDHHVADVAGFRSTLNVAVRSAAAGVITTIGIRPTRPETGFGYIELGDPLAKVPGASSAKRFVEKPDLDRARAFVDSGRFVWNAGMFIYRAADMMRALDRLVPDVADAVRAFDRAAAEGREAEAVTERFGSMPSVSIDVAVMEKLSAGVRSAEEPELAVAVGDFGWSDVGSWQAAWELAAKDASGNAVPEGTMVLDASGNLVVDARSAPAKKKVIALLGVRDLVVVDAGDALLVVPRDRAQDVRLVAEALKKQGSELS
jgi:mannose-1-phosphate guanylyltransferase